MWGGTALTCESIVGGSAYLPHLWQEAGLGSSADIFEALRKLPFQDRRSRQKKYRGKALPRDTIHVIATSDGSIPYYKYPGARVMYTRAFSFQVLTTCRGGHAGMQWEGMSEHVSMSEVPILAQLHAAVTQNLAVGGVSRLEFNQIIVTRYVNGDDNISRHSDDMTTIADPSVILNMSFGDRRTFSVYTQEGELVWSRPMESGSAFALSTETNKTHLHAIERESGAVGERISVVFRHITRTLSRAEVETKAKASLDKKLADQASSLRELARAVGDWAHVDTNRVLSGARAEAVRALLAVMTDDERAAAVHTTAAVLDRDVVRRWVVIAQKRGKGMEWVAKKIVCRLGKCSRVESIKRVVELLL